MNACARDSDVRIDSRVLDAKPEHDCGWERQAWKGIRALVRSAIAHLEEQILIRDPTVKDECWFLQGMQEGDLRLCREVVG